MQINITQEKYIPDVLEVIKLFEPHVQDLDFNLAISYDEDCECNEFSKVNIICEYDNKQTVIEKSYSNLDYNFRTLLKVAVYDCLSEHFNKQLPWGALTGIRPTKLGYELMKKGVNLVSLSRVMQNLYRVSKEKADLVVEIIFNQRKREKNDNLVNFYINIPFCTSKCSYCSFISAEIGKIQNFVSPYVDALIKEIEATIEIINEKFYHIKSIYIGGGTPTSLPDAELDRLLDAIPYKPVEYTVESGRPDTITREKLDILKKHGVTRISVNPQTFNDKILRQIGRNHTAMETIECYKMVREYDFLVNMDLIAGLPNETLKSFKESVDIAIELNPDNLTIHTLALKRASEFAIQNKDIFKKPLTEKMVDYASDNIIKNGYKPYYMYRQKNQVGNLENVGYFKNNSLCVFNVDSMEETATIIACGANAISKRVFLDENRIERQANVKDIPQYISRIDEMIDRKRVLFKN